jgi:hypothetical protein
MPSQDVSISRLKQASYCFLISVIRIRVISIYVTSGQTLRLLHWIYGEALSIVIFLIIWIKRVISFMNDGVMRLVSFVAKDIQLSILIQFFFIVHSLAAGLFLETDEIQYFEDIGYQHDLYRHCPSKESGLGCRCDCPVGTDDKSIDHDKNYDTCLPVWLQHVAEEQKKANWNVWS